MAEQVRLRDQQHTWTPEQDVLLKKYWRDGLSCSQVARALIADGCPVRTRNAIIGRVHRLGLPKRALTNTGCRSYQNNRSRAQRAAPGKRAAQSTSKTMLAARGLTPGVGPYAGLSKIRNARAASHALNAPEPIDPLNITLDELDAALHPQIDPETNKRPAPRFVCRAVTLTTEWGKPRYCGHDASGTYCDAHRARFYVTIEKKPRRLGASGVNRRADYRDSARWGAR